MNQKLRALLDKWRSQSENMWDAAYSVITDCADELEAVLNECEEVKDEN